MDVRVATPNRPNVTLEMTVVGDVKSDDCHKEADICFRELPADKIVLALENLLDSVKSLEEREYCSFISCLGGCEPGSIHAIYGGHKMSTACNST
jgi:hypothetical protein